MPEVDDQKYMQESKGNFMANEKRKEIEAPQNYGFTSVAGDADKGKDGKMQDSAETFIQFMGGNRSFPVMQNMDDRRHRLWGLEKGDSASFRQATDMLQSHMNKDGMFHTGPRDKTVRMQLVDQDSGDQQKQQGQQGSGPNGQLTFFDLMPEERSFPPNMEVMEGNGIALLEASGGGDGSQSQGGQQEKGQKSIYKKGQDSFRFCEVTKDKSRMGGDNVHLSLNDKETYVHCRSSDKHVYLGAEAEKKKFALVVTTAGPCKNVKGRIS